MRVSCFSPDSRIHRSTDVTDSCGLVTGLWWFHVGGVVRRLSRAVVCWLGRVSESRLDGWLHGIRGLTAVKRCLAVGSRISWTSCEHSCGLFSRGWWVNGKCEMDGVCEDLTGLLIWRWGSRYVRLSLIWSGRHGGSSVGRLSSVRRLSSISRLWGHRLVWWVLTSRDDRLLRVLWGYDCMRGCRHYGCKRKWDEYEACVYVNYKLKQ